VLIDGSMKMALPVRKRSHSYVAFEGAIKGFDSGEAAF
jgi:hypothetical protein